MNTILFITVGGSPDPIVTAINDLNPDQVIFICSTGSKGSQSQVESNILSQCRLIKNYELVLIDNPDHISEVYDKIVQKIQQIPVGDFLADYTGGTKTMSVGLAIAALDYHMRIHLTTANKRDNLIKVTTGQRVRRAPVSSLIVNRKINQNIPPLLERYNYPAAVAQLVEISIKYELSDEDDKHVGKILNQAKGLDLWDIFDHQKAYEYLKDFLGDNNNKVKPLIIFLKQVIGSRSAIDPDFTSENGINGHGYEIVEDLIFNAQRKAYQERYDDAVARLYRALELLVQIRLKREYQISTGDNKLGLMQSYELLVEKQDEPLGSLFREYQNHIQDKLSIRNYSIMAHGFKPITKDKYESLENVFVSFILKGIEQIISPKKLTGVQFPNSLA